MARGHEWLLAWYSAPSIPKRIVAVAVKIGLEGLVFAAVAGVIVSPVIVTQLLTETVAIEWRTLAGVWASLAVVLGRVEYCFTTTKQAADRDFEDA